MIDAARLDRAIADIPERYAGPGGALAVIKDGALVAEHAWGLADLDRRIPWTASTLSPICSISKEFTCAVLLDQLGDPAVLDEALKRRLPLLEETPPRTIDLANNQSGLRDYWALTVLCGAMPEGEFRPADSTALISRTRTLHFKPGTRYSYSNGNFRILSEMLEDRVGAPFADLVVRRMLRPIGMERAQFCPETSRMAGDAVGYEGNPGFGFVPAVNRIHWSGDAGISASLEDMITFEQWIDAGRGDPDHLYRRISKQPYFSDGRPAQYGLGLARFEVDGTPATSHGGGLRGWRSHRIHLAADRLSVVVLFNHHADARAAGLDLIAAVRGKDPAPKSGRNADDSWRGNYFDPESGLLVQLQPRSDGRLRVKFSTGGDVLDIAEDGAARSAVMTLTRAGDGFHMERPGDNIRARIVPVPAKPCAKDAEGGYFSRELEASFTCRNLGGAIFGGFEGFLGRGPMMPMRPVGDDIWTLSCTRSMDAPAPGDWTVRFIRKDDGTVGSVEIGCWLARHVLFDRTA